jgi:hypothetical protein
MVVVHTKYNAMILLCIERTLQPNTYQDKCLLQLSSCKNASNPDQVKGKGGHEHSSSRWTKDTDDGQWTMDDGGPQLQQHNNQTVHGRRRRKTVLATNNNEYHNRYGGNMIGGRRRACTCRVNQKGGCWSHDLMLPSDYKVRMVYSPLLQTSRWGLRHVAIT